MPTTGPNAAKGEKPPIMPLEATQHTSDGAKAFAQFFVKTIDWGYATTSGAYIRHLASSACSDCIEQAEFLDKARSLRRHFIGGRIMLVEAIIAAKALHRGSDYTAIVSFNIESFEEVTQTNKFVTADGAHSGASFQVSMIWRNERWWVDDLAANL